MEAVVLAEDAVVHGLDLGVPARHVHSLHGAGVGEQRLMGPRRSDPGADQRPARHTEGKRGTVKIGNSVGRNQKGIGQSQQQRRTMSGRGREKSATAYGEVRKR